MKLRVFKCDNCGMQTSLINENECHIARKEVLPYSQGWVYVYQTSFKIAREGNIFINDKHFCCCQCLADFIHKKLHESDKKDFEHCCQGTGHKHVS